MATGDAKGTAGAVGRELGLSRVEAGMTPESKHELVLALKRAGKSVAFAGDGVNDAPALAAADVGIAMGTGADVAIESAGITLLKGDLAGAVAGPPAGYGRRWATSSRICGSPLATTPSASRSPPACSIRSPAGCCRR